ncbi:MAG: MBL fold metallo-hydrolase [Candidatus Binataceae bacterium]
MNRNRARSNSAPATVTLLGTGDAFSSGGRSQSGYVIDAGGARVMLEAGCDVVGALKRNGIATNSLDLLIVSHLHGDHFTGLAFLILDYLWENPLKNPLTIAGPRKLEERTWRLMRTLYPGFDLAKIRRRLKFAVLEPGTARRFGKARVIAIRSPHTKPDISLSLRIEIGGKAIVFSGDTGWNDALANLAAGADLFLCECTYFESGHLKFHLNYPQLAANRDRFDVRRMVLTHLGREVLNRKDEVAIEMGFDGEKIEL